MFMRVALRVWITKEKEGERERFRAMESVCKQKSGKEKERDSRGKREMEWEEGGWLERQ